MTKADETPTTGEPSAAKRQTTIEARHLAEKIIDDLRRAGREAEIVRLSGVLLTLSGSQGETRL